MKAIILGTSSALPTKDRNHTAVLLRYGGEGILFDCGEGTQRQLRIAGENPMKISKIFITHWHGDHVLGLAGLIDSMAMNQGKKELEIYGPKGTKERVKALMKVFNIHPNYKLSVFDVSKSIAAETEEYWVRAVKVEHSIPCLAYSWEQKPRIKIKMDYVSQFGLSDHDKIEELRSGKNIKFNGKVISAKKATYSIPGKKMSYVMDTSLTDSIVKLVEKSNLLICESTFLNVLKAEASKRGHMTAKQAGKLAKSAGVDQLIITHFSQRYKDLKPLLAEAKKSFSNTKIAKDFMEISL
tara:strand:- start:3065 stop:3955 length:891 start_codon:yes stop_codon:yes gene_type:complete